MKLECMCLSNRLTSLSAVLGGRMQSTVELHTHTHSSWESHQGSTESTACWVGSDRRDEQISQIKSEFTSALPVIRNDEQQPIGNFYARQKSRVKIECTLQDMK